MFNQIISQALSSIREITAVPISYYRGTAYVGLKGTPTKSVLQATTDGGVTIDSTGRDYIVAAADLKLGGVVIEPAREDLIKERVSTKIHVYEVRRPDGSDQVWSYADAGRSTIRISTTLREITNG